MDKLSEVVKLAHENGLSYAQYQKMSLKDWRVLLTADS